MIHRSLARIFIKSGNRLRVAHQQPQLRNKGLDVGISRRSFSPSALGMVRITYIEADGTEKTVDAELGQHLLQIAHDNDIELEGACGGELACSTCHLIFEQEIYDTLPEKDEEEEDMLDLAFEVTETSRLGCQILVRDDMEGMRVRIPDDGF